MFENFATSREKSYPNRTEIAASLHTRFEDDLRAKKIALKSATKLQKISPE